MNGQKFYTVGRDCTLHTSASEAWEAWQERDLEWKLETYMLLDGQLEHIETIGFHDEHDGNDFYKKIVLAARAAELRATIAKAQKDLADIQTELTKK